MPTTEDPVHIRIRMPTRTWRIAPTRRQAQYPPAPGVASLVVAGADVVVGVHGRPVEAGAPTDRLSS
ncbi:MAG: hypothetical protein ABR511_10470 [Acidimicrobiales bacterium]